MEATDIEEKVIDPVTLADRMFKAMKRALANIGNLTKYLSQQKGAGVRTLKVTRGCYPATDNGMGIDPAFIRLCGRWLERAGFERGDFVRVITIKGMVLIVPVTAMADFVKKP